MHRLRLTDLGELVHRNPLPPCCHPRPAHHHPHRLMSAPVCARVFCCTHNTWLHHSLYCGEQGHNILACKSPAPTTRDTNRCRTKDTEPSNTTRNAAEPGEDTVTPSLVPRPKFSRTFVSYGSPERTSTFHFPLYKKQEETVVHDEDDS